MPVQIICRPPQNMYGRYSVGAALTQAGAAGIPPSIPMHSDQFQLDWLRQQPSPGIGAGSTAELSEATSEPTQYTASVRLPSSSAACANREPRGGVVDRRIPTHEF